MPIKHEFVVKTIARGSNNVTITSSIEKDFEDLRIDALTAPLGIEILIDIFIRKEGGVVTIDSLDTDGPLSTLQDRISISLHVEAQRIISKLSDNNGKIRLKFVLKRN